MKEASQGDRKGQALSIEHGSDLSSLIIDADAILASLRETNPEADEVLLETAAEAMVATGQAIIKAAGRLTALRAAEKAGRAAVSIADADLAMLRRIADQDDMARWAGPLLGPSAAAEKLGVSRATFVRWRRTGVIIGLKKGQRNHVIPMLQFRGSQPLPAIKQVLDLGEGDAPMVWAWLMQPNSGLQGTPPILALRNGIVDPVIRLGLELFAQDG